MKKRSDGMETIPTDCFGIRDVSDAVVEKVEEAVGMRAGAWDCVSPREIIAAAWNLLLGRRACITDPSSTTMRQTGAEGSGRV